MDLQLLEINFVAPNTTQFKEKYEPWARGRAEVMPERAVTMVNKVVKYIFLVFGYICLPSRSVKSPGVSTEGKGRRK